MSVLLQQIVHNANKDFILLMAVVLLVLQIVMNV